MQESALVWRRALWYGGECLGVEEGALVWMRMPGCHWKGEGGAPGSEESASGERAVRAPLTLVEKDTSGAEGAPYAKTQGGAATPGRPSLYPPLSQRNMVGREDDWISMIDLTVFVHFEWQDGSSECEYPKLQRIPYGINAS